MKSLLLLTGIWTTNDSRAPFYKLPWSPVCDDNTDAPDYNLRKCAIQWMLDQLASAVLALNKKAFDFFLQKHPRRCQEFLIKGRTLRLSFCKIESLYVLGNCHRLRQIKGCYHHHMRPSTADFSGIFDVREFAAHTFLFLLDAHFRIYNI